MMMSHFVTTMLTEYWLIGVNTRGVDFLKRPHLIKICVFRLHLLCEDRFAEGDGSFIASFRGIQTMETFGMLTAEEWLMLLKVMPGLLQAGTTHTANAASRATTADIQILTPADTQVRVCVFVCRYQ